MRVSAAEVFEVFVDYLADNVPQNSIPVLISLFIDRLKSEKCSEIDG